MENQRFLLYFTLFFVTYLLWTQWQLAYEPTVVETSPIENREVVPVAAEDINTIPATTQMIAQKDINSSKAIIGKKIEVRTDVLDLEIDTKGGDVRRATLLNYAIDANEPKDKYILLNDQQYQYHIAQSGLVSKNKNAPSHKALYTTSNTVYTLAENEDKLVVPFFWKAQDGTQVIKTYTFYRGKYNIDVNVKVIAGDNGWSGSQYLQLARTQPSNGGHSLSNRSYTGGVIYNDEIKYEKYDFGDMEDENLNQELDNGWLAMIEHYFVVAWIPERGNKNLYYSRQPSGTDRYILGVRGPAKKIATGETVEFNSIFVAGPKLQEHLEEIAPGLALTVDYGILTIFAKPLFSLLEFFHDWTNNWGWAIILLTISVKALFYKLSEMGYKSMAKMRKVGPRMKAMKERYGDDRQGMSKAMMDMYKKEKINPLGGCFPILIQMPVFLSLYWVLSESVEMRHAPFILWLNNLSAMDPLYILPILMGITMFIQQKLNPAPVDPVQAKVFQVMPFAFTIMFAFFPSGLVLYWVVNNILSIAQQYVITKRIENS